MPLRELQNWKLAINGHTTYFWQSTGSDKRIVPIELCLARWGVVECIERPLLMLEVRGSNPGHSISKNTTSLPRSPRGSPRSRAHPRISELSVRGRSQNQKKGFKLRSRNVSFCHGLEIWNGQIWALPSYPSNSQFIIQDITHVLHRELLSLMKLEKKLQIWTWHCGIYLIFKIWTRAIYYKPAWLRRSIWIKKTTKDKDILCKSLSRCWVDYVRHIFMYRQPYKRGGWIWKRGRNSTTK